ncbi:MAG: nucleotidyltransferase family protein [Acidobacteriota bacterium]
MAGKEVVTIGGILLAAGGSSRLGRPKQLVEFEGTTLLRRAAEALSASGCRPAVAVLGAESESSVSQFEGLAVLPIVNHQWASGMSSSIVLGIAALLDAEPALSAVMITLCDQPFVTTEIISRFLLKYRSLSISDISRTSIIAARYNGVLGVPSLFSSPVFEELKQLTGDKGARSLIRNADPDTVKFIDVPEAALDIDSPEDLRRLSTY